MQKLLLQCSSLDEAQRLKTYLESKLPYEVHVSFGKHETENVLSNRAIQLFIYDVPKFGADEHSFIREVRNMGFVYPVLTLASQVDDEEILAAMENQKIHFLDKPFEYKALRGITRKLMTQKTIPQQKFRRYKTNQRTQVETYVTAENLQCNMFNLSMGGAYMEFSGKPLLGVGDILRLQVPLKDLERHHNMSAKIIWTTRKGSYAGGFGVGVRFVKDKDVYRQLLDKV